MRRLFRAKGRLFWLEDAEGEPVSSVLAEGWPVLVDVGYELKPSPYQPLRVDIYGRGSVGLGSKQGAAGARQRCGADWPHLWGWVR